MSKEKILTLADDAAKAHAMLDELMTTQRQLTNDLPQLYQRFHAQHGRQPRPSELDQFFGSYRARVKEFAELADRLMRVAQKTEVRGDGLDLAELGPLVTLYQQFNAMLTPVLPLREWQLQNHLDNLRRRLLNWAEEAQAEPEQRPAEQSTQEALQDTWRDVLEAIQQNPGLRTIEQIGKKAGYEPGSRLRQRIADMRRLKFIGKRDGVYVVLKTSRPMS